MVNDHSQDNTLEKALKLAKTVIDLPINLGIGGCVQSGFIVRLSHELRHRNPV